MGSIKLATSSLAICSSIILLDLGGAAAQTVSKPVTNVPGKAATTVAAGVGRDNAGEVRQAILANTIVRGGKRFPMLPKSAPGTRSTGPLASCEPYETRALNRVAPIDLESGTRVKKDKSYPPSGPQVAIHSPSDPNYVVQSYTRVISSEGPPATSSVSSVPAGFSYTSAGAYNSVRQSTHNYIMSLSIPDVIKAELTAQAETMVSNAASYSASLSMSHGGVEHKAQVFGTGVANFSVGHSWYHASINVVEVCSPLYLRDPNVMLTRMKQWVDGTVSKLPRRVVDNARLMDRKLDIVRHVEDAPQGGDSKR